MKKVLFLAVSALLFTGSAFAGADKGKKKKKCAKGKTCCAAKKACHKKDANTVQM